VNFPDLSLLLFDQLLQDFLLFPDYRAELGVDDLGVELAPHQGRTFVVLDVALIDRLGELDVLAKALLLEVADGKLVGEGEEVKDAVPNMEVLKLTTNGTLHNRHQCRKTTVLGYHRCIINTGVEKNELNLNKD